MTVYGARGFGLLCAGAMLIDGAWPISVPVGLLVAGMAYCVSAYGWMRKSYMERVGQALESRLNDGNSQDPTEL